MNLLTFELVTPNLVTSIEFIRFETLQVTCPSSMTLQCYTSVSKKKQRKQRFRDFRRFFPNFEKRDYKFLCVKIFRIVFYEQCCSLNCSGISDLVYWD